jgi:hypothetical protein
METTRARAAGLFGVLVIAIAGILWHPSTLSGTRYVGPEIYGSNRGTTPIAFEQVPFTPTPAPVARGNHRQMAQFQDGPGQPGQQSLVDYGGIRPGFQGWGTGQPAAPPVLEYNVAGRGGTIYRVNTLADDRAAPVAVGDGTYRSSLRAAVEAAGPRVVVFETSGVICLTEPLIAYEPFLTIAGQTAPSPGINIRCNTFKVDGHDVLVQHIRFRFDAELGYPGSYETWPVQLGGTYNWTYNAVLDHVSVAFGNGYMSIGSGTAGQPNPWDIAVLDSLIAWPLATGTATPSYELTGYGLRHWAVGGGQGTAARNLFVHSSHRNLSAQSGKINWVNNAILGSGPDNSYTTLSFQGPELTANDSNPSYALFGVAVNNQFIPSTGTGSGYTEGSRPDHHTFSFWFVPDNATRGDQIYLTGNLGPFITGPTGQGQWSGVHFEDTGFGSQLLTETVPDWYAAQQFQPIPTETLPATLARTVGARPADRDSVDALAIEQFLAAASGDTSRIGSRISRPEELGLDLTLRQHFHDLVLPSNPNEIVDAVGRTALELWLEEQAQLVEGGTDPIDQRVLEISADHVAPQPLGTALTFTATPSGGAAQYKWWLFDGAEWLVLQDWSASNVFSVQPVTPNPAYIVGVWARHATSTEDIAELTAELPFPITDSTALRVSVAANRPPPQPAGTPTTITATASGGTAPYQYKFWVFDGALWSVVKDWSNSNTFTSQPLVPNSAYVVAVWARSATTTTDTEEASALLPYPITPAGVLQVRLSANQQPPQPAGSATTFTAAASGGQGSYQYKWWIFDGTAWVIVQDWSAAGARFTWQPATPNDAYIVGVWVRNAATTTDYFEISAELPFAITGSVPSGGPLQVGLTANQQPPQPVGSATTFIAAATGGQGSYQYKWWLFDGVNWTILQEWSTSNTFTWQAFTPNPLYEVGVWVRNASTTTDYFEISTQVPFPITP